MLDKTYDPKKYEGNIAEKWEELGVFKPENCGDNGTHVNILPPPNANGSLHLGHASGETIMDIAGRYARMNGKKTLLLPGKDHAGIMTQVIYEKYLESKGINKEEISREELYKGCYDFCMENSAVMRSQEKRIGISADWDREKFTLDPSISEDVLDTFVKMYEDGIAYKGDRIINWCPHCQTALSDMEVEHKEQVGKIWDLHYPLSDGTGKITVATTRPETMLGDTAIAVHPDDERYTDLIGKTVLLPIVNRPIPIVADSEIDMEFGSGAVKITPAHDPLDWKIGKKNNLAEITVIGKNGKIVKNEDFLEFKGLTTKQACDLVIEKFKKLGLLGKVKEHTKPLSTHDRCGKTIEPLISMQWWINIDHEKFSLKNEAIKAVKEGKIKIIPKHFEKTFFHWMENLQDWCISRQLWWGHQIPAWYCQDCSEINVTKGEKTEIYLIRHGETDLNAQNRRQGKGKNPSLNDNGIKQIRDSIEEIKKINPDILISSPLKRTTESAEIISKEIGIELIIDDRLVERDYGIFEGTSNDEVLKELKIKSGAEINFFDKIENGESYEKFTKRLKSLFDEIEKKHKGKKVLLVGHGGITRVLRVEEKKISKEMSLKMPIPNANIEEFIRFSKPSQCKKCGKTNLIQDQDTFDTWFSSGQWAHNTVLPFGEKEFFPGDFMVMGRDIIFFWACRMIMMSLYSTGEIPFKKLYLTGLILDKNGKKMSKSKGNGIDPLEMADKYGTDALRLSLFIGNAPGTDMRLWEEKIENFRNFVNKIWNASRFIQLQLESKKVQKTESIKKDSQNFGTFELLNFGTLTEIDKWILSSVQNLIEGVTKDIEAYQYSQAGQKLYDFTWNEFCDWYLELSKGENQNLQVLVYTIQTLLKLLHPFIPFVTEAVYGELFESKKVEKKESIKEELQNFGTFELLNFGSSLSQSSWPKVNKDFIFKSSLKNIDEIIGSIKAIRELRREMGIEPAKKVNAKIKTSEKFISESSEDIKRIARIDNLEIGQVEKGKNDLFAVISSSIEVILPAEGNVDIEKEKQRKEKEISELEKQIKNLEGRLANKSYTEKAPVHLVDQTKKELEEAKKKLEILNK